MRQVRIQKRNKEVGRMKNARQLVLGVVGIMIGLALAAPAATSAPTPKNDVRVINTPAEAVPVAPQGTTQVAGTINVGNIATVDVQNAQGDPLFVQEVGASGQAAPQPYQRSFDVFNADNRRCDELDVPDGKRLTLENVMFQLDIEPGGLPSVHIEVTRSVETSQFPQVFAVALPDMRKVDDRFGIDTYQGNFYGPVFAFSDGAIDWSLMICVDSDNTHVRGVATGILE